MYYLFAGDQMIIDAHNHIGHDKDGLSQTIEELLVNMRKYRIDAAVIFPFDENGNLIEASKSLLNKHPNLYPFMRFDPKAMSVDQLKTMITDFKGVKLHPRAQAFNPVDKAYFPLYEVMEKSNKPLFIHTRKYYNKDSDPDVIATLADEFPKLNIIMGHFASFSPIALDYVKKKDNLYIETSTVSTHRLVALGCSKVGADKIIFGSDMPYSDCEIEMLKVKKAPISAADKESILCGNIKRILGI